MAVRFRNRSEAGKRLAEQLKSYRDRDDTVVLGLPRGGVPVALEIARGLNAPLDVYIVRKLGTPGQEELAMGAIGSGGTRVLNQRIIHSLDISEEALNQVEQRERRELKRREERYRGGRPRIELKGKTVILVDDGLATGASMKTAARAVRKEEPREIVVAVGTAPKDTVDDFSMSDVIDRLVVGIMPSVFFGVGGSYSDFSQTTDEEVIDCLEKGAGDPLPG